MTHEKIPLLEVLGVTKRFGGLAALQDVSLKVERGAIVGLIGPNGAGKTTLFNVITGFLSPEAGRITFKGEDITGRPPHEICKKGIARTFQRTLPFKNLTVIDNMVIGGICRAESVEKARKDGMEMLEFLNLSKKANFLASALTTAERKRLEFARALATKPDLILVDEIVSGLNDAEIAAVLATVKEVRDKGITLLVVEHVIKAIVGLSDQIVVLHYGKKLAEGPAKHVLNDSKVIEAYLGTRLK